MLVLGGEKVVGKHLMSDLVSDSLAAFDAVIPADFDTAVLGADEKVCSV
jgi:hypothetical protein